MTIKLWNDLDNSNTVNAGDTVAATAVTAKGGALDKDGYYAFTGLKAGEYVVQGEVCDAGWMTEPTTAETTGTCGSGVYPITVGSGFSELRNDFGIELGTKAGYKFDDVNGNGAWATSTEPGINGVTIKLAERPGQQQHGQRRRHRGGDRGHGQGRGAGQDRLLRVHRAEGRGVRGAGGLRRRLDPDEADHGWRRPAPAATGSTLITVGSGFSELRNDFGNFKLGTKAGYKFDDVNGNGAWATSTEPGINGVTIKLWNDLDNSNTVNAGDTVAATAVTAKGGALDKDGYYAFTGLKAGEYVVQEVCDAGWIQTKPTTAETTGTCGDGVYPITVGLGLRVGATTSATSSRAPRRAQVRGRQWHGPGRPSPSRGPTACRSGVERPGQHLHRQRRRHRGGDCGHGQGRGAGQRTATTPSPGSKARRLRGAGGLRRRLGPDVPDRRRGRPAPAAPRSTRSPSVGVLRARNDFGNFKQGTKSGTSSRT